MEQNIDVLTDINDEVNRIAGTEDTEEYTQNIEVLKAILGVLQTLVLKQYVKSASVDSDRDVALDMTGYTYAETDIINVFIDGKIGVSGTDWSIDTTGETAAVTIAGASAVDVVVTVLKMEG